MAEKQFHRISNVDVESRRADCSICGRTDVKIKWAGRRMKTECGTYARHRRREHWKRTAYAHPEGRPDFDELSASQGGACALCRKTPKSGRYRNLVIDHCHETGRFRGVICRRCNTALGQLGDNRGGSLIAYLSQTN